MSRFFKITAGAAVVAVALYAAAGYVAVPWLAKTVLEKQVADTLKRKVTVGKVSFNPWLWQFELRNLKIDSKSGPTPFLALASFRLDVSAQTFSSMAPVIEEITVDGLNVRVNLADEDVRKLLEGDSKSSGDAAPAEKESSSGGLPQFALYNIAVKNSSFRVVDPARSLDQAMTDFNLTLPFVSTLPGAKESLVTPSLAFNLNGTPVTATGSTRPFGSTLEAQLQARLSNLDIAPMLRLVPALNSPALKVDSGLLSTDISLIFRNPTGGKAGKMLVSGTASLSDVKTSQQIGGKPQQLASVKRASLRLLELDLIEQQAKIQTIVIDEPKVTLINAAGGLNVTKTAEAFGGAESAQSGGASAPSSAPAAKSAVADRNGWHWSLETLQLKNGSVSWLDTTTAPNARIPVTGINVTVRNLKGDPGSKPGTAEAAAKLLGGSLSVVSEVTPAPLAVSADVKLTQLSATQLSPYIRKALNADLAAQLSADVKAGMKNGAVTASGTASVANVTLKQGKTQLVSVKNASVKLKSLDLASQKVTVDSVKVTALVISLEKNAKGINLAQLGASNTAKTAEKPDAKTDTKTGAKAEHAGAAWAWQLNAADVTEGRLNFRDTTVKPAVSMSLTNLTAKARNFSSAKGAKGTAEVSAKLAGGSAAFSGPVVIDPLETNMAVNIAGLQLKDFSPVMAAYAGLGAKSGTLNAKGQLSVETVKNEPIIGWAGDIDLATFNMTNNRGKSLMTWKDASLTGLNVKTTDPITLVVAQAVIDQPGTKETKTVRQSANILGSLAALAGKEKLATKIEKVDSKLDGKIVLSDIRYENGRFSAGGTNSATVTNTILQKLSQSMSAKLGTGTTASGTGK